MQIRKLESVSSYVKVSFYIALYKLRREDRASFFGSLWYFIDPLATIAMYYVFFVLIVGFRTENYLLALVIGLTYWKLFASSVQSGLAAIVSYRPYVKGFNASLVLYIISSNLYAIMKSFPAFVVLMLACYFFGSFSFLSFVWIMLLFLYLSLFCFSLSLFSSLVRVYVPDVSQIVDLLLRGGMFVSGVFVPLDQAPGYLTDLLLLNPIAAIIEQARSVIIDNTAYGMDYFIVSAIIFILLASLGYVLINRFQGKVAQQLFI